MSGRDTVKRGMYDPALASAMPSRRALDRAQVRAISPTANDIAHSRAVHESWRRYFRTLPSGARLLDVAPGIGPVALIAREISEADRRSFEVHGLDQASTFNAEPLELNGIRFHARRYGRSTPFADGYFDAVSAQWAPPDDDAAADGIVELRRILKHDGRARLMYHALGGITHEQCLGRLLAVDTLLDKLKLMEHARRMFDTAAAMNALKSDAVSATSQAQTAQSIYANIANWAMHLMRATPNPLAGGQILQVITDCWERRLTLKPSEIQACLDQVEGEMRATQERMRNACALAVDESRAHHIGRLFKKAGFKRVKVQPFKDADDSLVGWDLQAA